jgi:hypothetical protein
MITSSNLDYLLPALRLQVGDPNETVFSESLLLTGLVNGVKMLGSRWGSKYLIDSNNDVYRNTAVSFTYNSPPVVEQQDEIAIVLAASVLVRRSALTSSASAFTNWSTPDLTFSNVQASKTLLDLLKSDEEQLNMFFKGKLGKTVKQTIGIAYPEDLLGLLQEPPIQVLPQEVRD